MREFSSVVLVAPSFHFPSLVPMHASFSLLVVVPPLVQVLHSLVDRGAIVAVMCSGLIYRTPRVLGLLRVLQTALMRVGRGDCVYHESNDCVRCDA